MDNDFVADMKNNPLMMWKNNDNTLGINLRYVDQVCSIRPGENRSNDQKKDHVVFLGDETIGIALIHLTEDEAHQLNEQWDMWKRSECV